MSKKKNNIPKLTDEQYNLYIAGLKNSDSSSLYDADGNLVVPEPFPKKK